MRLPAGIAPPLLLMMLAATTGAQEPDRSVLDIPEQIEIPGRASYDQVTGGAKQATYYGTVFPIERGDSLVAEMPATALPEVGEKAFFPMPLQTGARRATDIYATAIHYGDGLFAARRVANFRDWLTSAEGGLGAGRGHVSGAGWHREFGSVNARRAFDWRTAVETGVDAEFGRSGVWGMAEDSHRDYVRIGASAAGERFITGDHQIRLEIEAAQRNVESSKGTAVAANEASERAFLGRFHWQNANGRFWLRGDATIDLIHTARDSGSTGTGQLYVVGAEAWTRPEENFGGALGVTIYSAEYLGGDSLRAIRPTVTAWARLLGRLKLTARLASGVDRYGVWEAFRDQRFLDVATSLRMPFRSIDIDVNGEVAITANDVAVVGLREQVIQDFPVWWRPDDGAPFVIDTAWVGGRNASLLALYARYRRTWSFGTFDALAIARSHSLRSEPIPYVPDWELHLGSTMPIWRDVEIAPAARLIGARHFHLPGSIASGELGTRLEADLEVLVPFPGGWIATAAAQNIFARKYERWQGVTGPGFHVQLGVRRTW